MIPIETCLTRLGYLSNHPLLEALRRNEAIDLNTPDENGFTPLRIAIQRRDTNIIKRLYELEPNPKHLSDYDRAMIDEVVHQKKEAFTALPLSSHREIIRCIQALYSLNPNNTNGGVCFGIAQMGRKAFFEGRAELFRKQLKNIKLTLWPLIEKVMAEVSQEGVDLDKDLVGFFKNVRKKLQGQFPYHIWYDIYAFLDGIILYTNPINFPELFEPGVLLAQHLLAAENLLSSEESGVLSQHVFSGYYTRPALFTYFKCLDKTFKNTPHPISFLIHFGGHIFVIDYWHGKWIFTDANYLSKGETEYNNEEIAKILLSFNAEPLIFATIPFIPRNTEKSFNQLITALKEEADWLSIHASLTEEQTTKYNNGGYDLLYIAALNGDIETVRLCIRVGAKIVAQGSYKCTALHAAATGGSIDVVKELIKALKDAEKINQPDNHGYTPLHIAAAVGYIDVVKELIKALKDAEKINQPDNHGYTPLHIAAAGGYIDVVKELIKALKDAEKINQPDNDGSTPLRIAAAGGYIDVVKELIKALKDAEKINQPDNEGSTPLHIAARRGHIDVVKELIKALKDAEKINQPDNEGSTPLYLAAQCGFPVIIDELLNHGADITTSMQANTPILLDTAKKQGCEEKLQQLFIEEKIGNILPGFTPLHGAIAFGHEDTVQLLVERGATWTETTSGISPYKLAVVMNRVDLLPAKLKQQYSQLKEGMSLVRTHIDVYLQENKESSLDKEIECCIAYLTNENHFIDSGLEGLLRAIAQANTKFTTEVSFQKTLETMASVLQRITAQQDAKSHIQNKWPLVVGLSLYFGARAVSDASKVEAAWRVFFGVISVAINLATKVLDAKLTPRSLPFFANRVKSTHTDSLAEKETKRPPPY